MSDLHLSRAQVQPFGPAGAFLLTDAQVSHLGGGNRAALGVEIGDVVDAVISLDEAPCEVEVPPALAAALAGDPVLGERYDALAYTHRKEFAVWVAEAKREETRARRVAQALEMLREGRTRS